MKKNYKIEGMHCNSCATTIELELEDKPGVKKVRADFSSEKAEIEFDGKKITENEIKKIIEKLGYKAR